VNQPERQRKDSPMAALVVFEENVQLFLTGKREYVDAGGISSGLVDFLRGYFDVVMELTTREASVRPINGPHALRLSTIPAEAKHFAQVLWHQAIFARSSLMRLSVLGCTNFSA
jgi:hypothetical protein